MVDFCVKRGWLFDHISGVSCITFYYCIEYVYLFSYCVWLFLDLALGDCFGRISDIGSIACVFIIFILFYTVGSCYFYCLLNYLFPHSVSTRLSCFRFYLATVACDVGVVSGDMFVT